MKTDLDLAAPLMNAAGTLGFAPVHHGPLAGSHLGAFITNPISLQERSPARGVRYLAYPGGFLLHTGYPNPGLKTTIRRYAARWSRSPIPVIVNLLPGTPSEAAEMVRRLEPLGGVTGVEISLPPRVDSATAVDYAQASLGELPVILRLPLESALSLAPYLVSLGLSALSLAPPRGALPTPDGGLIHGRLYGPAVFPLALETVRGLAGCGIPVIAAGGIYTQQQANAALQTGAYAIQLDTVLWRDGGFDLTG